MPLPQHLPLQPGNWGPLNDFLTVSLNNDGTLKAAVLISNYGGVADCQQRGDAVTTNGTTALTSATATFVPGDVGKTILVQGAGVAGDDLRTTIAAYVSATAVTLTDPAGASVSSKNVYWGTDNKAAIDSALLALAPTVVGGRRVGGNRLVFAAGSYLSSGGHVAQPDIVIEGANAQATNIVHTGNNTFLQLASTSLVNYGRKGVTGLTLWGNSGSAAVGIEIIGQTQFPFLRHLVIGDYSAGIALQLHNANASDFVEGVHTFDLHLRSNLIGVQFRRDSGGQSFAYQRFVTFEIHVPLNGVGIDFGTSSTGTCYLNGGYFNGVIWLEGDNAIAVRVGANGKMDATSTLEVRGEITGSHTGCKILSIASGGSFNPRGRINYLNAPDVDVASATLYRNPTRQSENVEAQGIISEPFSRNVTQGTQILVSGTLQGVLVDLLRGQKITGVGCQVSVNGSSLTLSKVGIRSTAGVLLASSADQSALFTSGSVGRSVQVPLSAPWVVTDDDAYYLEIIVVGSVPPTLVRGSNISFALTALGTGVLSAEQKAGQSDIPPSYTVTGTGTAFWLCAY